MQGIPLLFRDTLAIQGAAAVPYLGESYPWELFNPNDNNSPLWATVWGLSIGRSMLIVPPPAP